VIRANGGGRRDAANQQRLPKVVWPRDSQDMATRDALAIELLKACMAALKTYGLGARKLAQLAREAANGKAIQVDSAKRVLEAAHQLAEMIAKWGEDPMFLDASGRPAVLSINGRKSSFRSLATKFFPAYAISDVVKFGCEANAIERVGNGKIARLNDSVVFTGNSVLILAHSVRTVRRFLSTANFNRQPNIPIASGRPDRTSFGEISEKEFSEFIRVMRPQLSDMIEMSNRWLGQRAKRPKSAGRRKKMAGVQAFLFCD
jgi:hypothetical protein